MGRIKPSSSRYPGFPLHWLEGPEPFGIAASPVRTRKASRRRVKQGLGQGDTAGEPAQAILADAGIRMLPCTSKEAVTSWSGGGHV
ncbi:hypothetical protein CGCF413_v003352 [Colletotrichum fructicola]|nr:hypothetical protein CGCF413_v003352 [Colletotrichum fructicola]